MNSLQHLSWNQWISHPHPSSKMHIIVILSSPLPLVWWCWSKNVNYENSVWKRWGGKASSDSLSSLWFSLSPLISSFIFLIHSVHSLSYHHVSYYQIQSRSDPRPQHKKSTRRTSSSVCTFLLLWSQKLFLSVSSYLMSDVLLFSCAPSSSTSSSLSTINCPLSCFTLLTLNREIPFCTTHVVIYTNERRSKTWGDEGVCIKCLSSNILTILLFLKKSFEPEKSSSGVPEEHSGHSSKIIFSLF